MEGVAAALISAAIGLVGGILLLRIRAQRKSLEYRVNDLGSVIRIHGTRPTALVVTLRDEPIEEAYAYSVTITNTGNVAIQGLEFKLRTAGAEIIYVNLREGEGKVGVGMSAGQDATWGGNINLLNPRESFSVILWSKRRVTPELIARLPDLTLRRRMKLVEFRDLLVGGFVALVFAPVIFLARAAATMYDGPLAAILNVIGFAALLPTLGVLLAFVFWVDSGSSSTSK
jgi:hypothetical protein